MLSAAGEVVATEWGAELTSGAVMSTARLKVSTWETNNK